MRPRICSFLGAFMGIAPIALNAILDASIHVGETVVVFGAGTVGQMIAQLARLNGARVIAVDLEPMRLQLARRLGADLILNPREGPVAERVKELTDGRGADVCIEATGAASALHEATRACAYSAQVIAAGFFQGAADALYLGEEFHHNRVNIVCSQIYGVNPSLTYRWNRARLDTAVIDLLRTGALRLPELVTHVIPFQEGARAFEIADRHPESAVQIMLSF
jgi:threonine dehydrogenase-like Zn-dependent dehydrogenase